MTITEKIIGGAALLGLLLMGIGHFFDAPKAFDQGVALIVLSICIAFARNFLKRFFS